MSSPAARETGITYHKLDLGSNPRFIAMALLMGLTMMGSGIYMYANEARDYFNVLPPELEKMKHLRTVIIMSGVCTCFVATFGLCGVLQESQTTLMTYLIMTLALFIINMVVGSFALIFRGTMEENLGHMLGDSLKNERHWKSWFKLQAKITESLKGSIVTMGVVGCSLLVLQFLLLVATLIILVHLRKKASPGSESTTPNAAPPPSNGHEKGSRKYSNSQIAIQLNWSGNVIGELRYQPNGTETCNGWFLESREGLNWSGNVIGELR
nr:hypothetical protein BaRGS_022737 [Batillaria attramentaria]